MKPFKYFIVIYAFLFSLNSLAVSWYSNKGAVNSGYDVVAYFTQNKPVKGSPRYQLEWNGGTWYFSSAANKQKFKTNPSKYAPQYGGYCAYAVTNGYKAKVSPNAWTIIDGKLYLNFSKNVRRKWLKDRDNNIQKADQNWSNLQN